MKAATDVKILDAVVVGAGAAGVGVGIALRHAGVENFAVIDRHGVGASFDRWPAETRFITPSFADQLDRHARLEFRRDRRLACL